MRSILPLTTFAFSLCLTACGGGGGGDGDDAGTGGPEQEAPEDGIGRMGMRRLTQVEFDNTVADLLGDDGRLGSTILPEDKKTPFDNEFQNQDPSRVLVEGVETLAGNLADRLLADPPRRDIVVGCTPTGAADRDCMTRFVRSFGRRALRRALTDDEVTDFVDLGLDFAAQGSDFHVGVGQVVRTILQDAEFVYRIELGTAEPDRPGVFRLSGYEVATRMSYLIWGTTPDDALLDSAEAGELETDEGRRTAAQRMIDRTGARKQLDRVHAMWLGYDQLPHDPALTGALRQETRALIDRVVFDDRASWLDLFTATQTFVDDTLAIHYGLAPPGSSEPVWVDYDDSGRQGILSHGAFLSTAANPDDTSPTKRGKLIRNRLMCQIIPPPPPDVMADAAPSEGECKVDRYAAHRNQGACAGCHDAMDPIGFGLENYGLAGEYRDHDDDAPQCIIDGVGELVEFGTFTGPAQLSQMLIDNDILGPCAVEQVYRYAMGHPLEPEDRTFTDALAVSFADGGFRMDQLLVELVAHRAFAFRMEEVAQ